MTKREQILQALFAVLETVGNPATPGGPEIKLNTSIPPSVPANGLVVMRDGDPGEPDVTLSPLTYHWQHQVPVEVVVQKASETDRRARLDAIIATIGTAVESDRSLGGLAEWLEIGPPSLDEEAVEGAAALKGATIPVIVHYASAGALS